MLGVGCQRHGLPGATAPEGFEVIRPTEVDLSVLEVLSFLVGFLHCERNSGPAVIVHNCIAIK